MKRCSRKVENKDNHHPLIQAPISNFKTKKLVEKCTRVFLITTDRTHLDTQTFAAQ